MIKPIFARGFTLIELLIVVAIIGILAVALLSAINPIEQLNKSRDTSRQSAATQLLGALERYYANNEMYPWNENPSKVLTEYYGNASATGLPGSGAGSGVCGTSCTDKDGALIAQGELKDSFLKRSFFDANRSPFDNLYIHKEVNQFEIKICFAPQSQSMRETNLANGSVYIYTEDVSLGTYEYSSATASQWTGESGSLVVCVPE